MANKQIIIAEPDPRWGTDEDTQTHVVLVHPEIPGNTGNIARLCAATGVVLHLVEPLGFVLQDRYLRRAGLDYWPRVTLCVHPRWEAITAIFPRERLHLFSTRATARQLHTDMTLEGGSVLVFGRETRGLDDELVEANKERLVKIPITSGVRSLNLANACAIAVYEAMRQQGFRGD